MAIQFKKQSQFELFPGASERGSEKIKSSFSFSNITLTLDNLVVVGVVFIMLLVITFSLGVERGKRVALMHKPLQGSILDNGVKTADSLAVPAHSIDSKGSDEVLSPVSASFSDTAQIPKEKTFEGLNDKIVDKSANKRYTIQVASFKKKAFAVREASDLKEEGYDSFVMPKGAYFIVCVGHFSQRDEAKGFAKKFNSKYRDYYIRSL